MNKLLELLIDGCWHRWQETDRAQVADANSIVIGYASFCRCEKCGLPKRFNLYSQGVTFE